MGCSTPPQKPESKPVPIQKPIIVPAINTLHFSDIAIPPTFTLLKEESYSHETQAFRNAHLRYVGKLSLVQTLAFFKTAMLENGWITGKQDSATTILNFEKNEEKCSVSLSTEGADTFITIRLR